MIDDQKCDKHSLIPMTEINDHEPHETDVQVDHDEGNDD